MDLLQKHPKVILVIYPMDAIMAKDVRRNDSLAAEEAIRELVESEIPVIGGLGPAGHLILDSRAEWGNLFDVYKIPEPKPERIVEILMDMLPEFRRHYSGIEITDKALNSVYDYAKRIRPSQREPRRSIQFLDELYVRAFTASPRVRSLDLEKVEEFVSEPIHPPR
jgi:hypothetical protein